MNENTKIIIGVVASVAAIIIAQIIMKKLNIIKLQQQQMRENEWL
jgi:hypothetical protein